MWLDPCKNLFNSQILNTIEGYGKIYLCCIKHSKNAEIFKRPWHIVQEGMAIILRDKTTRLPMQSFEFSPGTVPFLTGNVLIYRVLLQYFIRNKHQRLEKQQGRLFKACFAHWPDLKKKQFLMFTNFRHQSVHKAPGGTLITIPYNNITSLNQMKSFHDLS